MNSGEKLAGEESPWGRNGQSLDFCHAESLAGAPWEELGLSPKAKVAPEGMIAGGRLPIEFHGLE